MENANFEPQGSLIDVLEKCTDFEPAQASQTSTSCLIEDFIWPGQIVQISAQGCGTWVTCETTSAIAEGRKLLSQFEGASAVGVLICQGGMSHAHFTGRLNRMITGTGHAPVKVISPAHFTSDAAKNLCDKDIQDQLFSWLTKQDAYRVLILDGIDCFLPEKPEAQQINRLLDGFRKTSMTVITIESGGRGGLPLSRNQPDLILSARALDTFDDLVIRIDFEKARSLRRDQQKTFFIKLVEHENGKFSFEEALMDEFLKAKTLQLLLKNWTQQKIAKETGKDQSTVSRWINNVLLPDSLVVRDGRKYLPTEAGRKLLGEHDLSDF